MTFDAHEISGYDGKPIDLYEFQRGVAYWRYTSADEDQTYLSHTFSAEPISRSEFSDMAEMNKKEFSVSAPYSISVAQQFIAQPPGEVVTLKVWQRHRHDVDVETRLAFVGRVLSPKWEGQGVTLSCEPISTSLRRTGLRRTYGAGCQHVLYRSLNGLGCELDQADFRVTDTASAVVGSVITVPAASGHADGYYNGGFLWWQLPDGRRDGRMIIGHTGELITLTSSIVLIAAGDSVEIYPGCNHTKAQCNSRFSNTDNYGGWPFKPDLNPFGGSMVY